MKQWIERAIRERKVTFVLAIALLLYGIYAYYYLPKQENPDTSSPMAQILTVLPGASAEEVETLVTRKVEKAASELEGISYITSYSNPNASVVLVSLDYSVDYETEWRKLRTLLQELHSELPEDALTPDINTNLTESSGAIYTITSDTLDKNQVALDLADRLSQIEGIKKVSVEGADKSVVKVIVNGEKLDQSPLTYSQVADLIKVNNLNIPAGSILEDSKKVSVTSEKQMENAREVSGLTIGVNPLTGDMIQIKDIAEVVNENSNTHIFKVGQSHAVIVNVFFEKDENIVLIGDRLTKAVSDFKAQYSEDLKISPFVFQPKAVKVATESFMINLLQGVGFVILVILFGMGIRNAVVVSTSIPLSIAITIGIMYLMGIDLQQMSIAALIIALGILVDNSIVISDAIQEHLNEGRPVFESCFEGTRESGIPVLTSTLTTIAAFAPLMVLPGEAGEFAKSLPLVVILSLVASYIVAIFLVPALASVFFKKQQQTRHHSKNLIRKGFSAALRGALDKRKTAYISIVLIIAGAAYGAMQLDVSLFPYADKNTVYIDITAPIGASLEETEALVESVSDIIIKENPRITLFKSIGGAFPKFYLTVGVRPPSDNIGQLVYQVPLANSDAREKYLYQMQKKLEDSGLDGQFSVNVLEINQPGPAVDVRIFGSNREDINATADAIEAFLKADERTLKVINDKPSKIIEKKIKYDENALLKNGLMLYDVQRQVNIALSGYKTTSLYSGNQVTPVYVEGVIETIEDLNQLKVGINAQGVPIRLNEVAVIGEQTALSQVKRHKLNPAVFVTADLKPGASASALQTDIEAYVDSLIFPEGVTINYGGDKEVVDKYIKDLLGAAIIAVIIIYLILLIQFNSFKQPIIVLATVPLSVVGSVGILLIFNMKITFTVGLGVASLIGIVVNNAILLLDYLNANDKEVADYKRLCISAMNRRFKPIMLSSITTIIGLLPLALSGSSFFTPMAVALMGGLLVSTLLTLIVIPLIYYSTLPKKKKFMKF